jgi:hypothetical protein
MDRELRTVSNVTDSNATLEGTFSRFYLKRTPGWEAEFISQYNSVGMVTLDGITSREDFVTIARRFGDIYRHRDSDFDGLTTIANSSNGNRDVGFKGFTAAGLDMHTDRSGIPNPPHMLGMWCKRQADRGGDSAFVDGRELFLQCARFNASLLELLTSPRTAVFGGPIDPFVGSVFNKTECGSWSLRFRSDELGFFCLPLANRIGEFTGMLTALAITFRLMQGQAYFCNQHRWLHGRTAFIGTREMYRALVVARSGSRLAIGFST